MQTQTTGAIHPEQQPNEPVHTPQFPLEKLVHEVYDAAPPEQRDQMIAHMIGRVYEVAPPLERSQLLTQLIKPLSLLSLSAVAGGIFTRLRFYDGWDVPVPQEDTRAFGATEVAELAQLAQQVSRDAVAGLSHIITQSPMLFGSGFAALLVALLLRSASTVADSGHQPFSSKEISLQA